MEWTVKRQWESSAGIAVSTFAENKTSIFDSMHIKLYRNLFLVRMDQRKDYL
jgi:hypothetical protein